MIRWWPKFILGLSMSEFFSVTGVTAGYGASTVLHGVSLTLQPGRICTVLGKNGVGKTTLIRAIAGHCHIRTGRVVMGPRDLTNLPAHEIAQHRVGLVPQGRRLFPTLTVREHLLVGARATEGQEPGWSMHRVIEYFPRIGERLSNLGNMLSGGEQSMVAIGRALVGNPKVLLLDEPSEGLSPLLVNQVAEVLQTLRDEGIAILLVEQNYGLAMKLSDQINIMSKGQIVHTSTPEQLKASPEIRSQFLGV
ncbi:ABC transporter ATP-binding protein [Pusillimonas sp. T2]|nr:ABC transporter ATP-binding protein [Pusillimonas sp. T2]